MSDYYSDTPMLDLLTRLDQTYNVSDRIFKVNRYQWPAKGRWDWDDDKRFNKIASLLEEERENIITQINELADKND